MIQHTSGKLNWKAPPTVPFERSHMTKDQSEESNSCSLPAIHINQAMNIINNSLKNNSTEYNVHCMFVVNSYAYKYVLQGRIINVLLMFFCCEHLAVAAWAVIKRVVLFQ